MARFRAMLYRDEFGGRRLPDGKMVVDLVAEVLIKNVLQGSVSHLNAVLPYTEPAGADDGADDDESESIPDDVAERMLRAANEP